MSSGQYSSQKVPFLSARPQKHFLAYDPEKRVVAKPSAYGRLWELLSEDRSDLLIVLSYTLLAGLLSLAVPLAAQALVSSIAAGGLLQPVGVLVVAVAVCLLIAGVLQLLQLSLSERLQQRIFARVALRLSARLPFVRQSALNGKYAPQLVNRFFDVVIVQKNLAKLLLDAPPSALQVVGGLILLAIYSTNLLAFYVLLLVFAALLWLVSRQGLETSIKESYKKYDVAQWLEELGRCQAGFKMSGVAAFPIERADQLTLDYVEARQAHFRVIFWQSAVGYGLRAAASAGILGFGGFLVIDGQLTIGQLVAAELVVITVLSSLEKLIRLLEDYYDLLASLDKLGSITDLPVEKKGGVPVPNRGGGATVHCSDLYFSYNSSGRGVEVIRGLDLKVAAGERVSIVGTSGAGKSTLAALLCGLQEADRGTIQINNIHLQDADRESLRRVVGLVTDTNEIFAGTVEENIVVGRPGIDYEDVEWALEFTRLTDELKRSTPVVSEGRNLSHGQIQRLLIARAIVARPSLLILDEAFTGIDERDKIAILDNIYRSDQTWTVIDISHDPEVVERSQTIRVLEDGQIVESKPLTELRRDPKCKFVTLFPSLCLSKKSSAAPSPESST